MLVLRIDAASDVGRVRERNEDSFVVDEDFHIYIVCDGMGGHNAGDVASAEAAAESRRFLRMRFEELNEEPEEEDDAGPTEREQMLGIVRATVQKACAHVYNLAQEDVERAGMGCTMTMLVFRGARGYVGHVGDCRLWLVRDGKAHLLTEDHRVVTELLKKGELTEEEAREFPFPNSLSRSVGVHPVVSVDTLDFDVMEGDRFLLCSDGLHEYMADEDVETLVWAPDGIDGLPDRLVELANSQGGRDNITALCIEVQEIREEVTQVSVETLNMLEFIRQIPIFRDLDFREVTTFLNYTQTIDYQAGDAVCTLGEPGDGLHVLLYGTVQVTLGAKVLGDLGSGEPVGETSFLDGGPHSASVEALEVTRSLLIGGDQLRELARSSPLLSGKLMMGLARTLASRLRSTTAKAAGAVSS